MNTRRSITIIFRSGFLFFHCISTAACGVGQSPAATVTAFPTEPPALAAVSTVAPTITPTSQPNVQEKLIMEIDPQIDLEFLVANLIISPDLQHAALIVQEQELYIPIVDGKRWQPLENGHTPVFNPDSKEKYIFSNLCQAISQVIPRHLSIR